MVRYVGQGVRWLGRQEAVTLMAIALVCAGLWAFVELADEVMEGETQTLDENVLLMLRDADDPAEPWGPQWFSDLVRDVTALGGVAVITIITASAAGFLAVSGRPRLACFVVAAVIGGQLVNSALKRGFDRPRPDLVPHGAYVTTASFPSGHATMAATAYLTLGSLLAAETRRRRVKAYLLSWAVGMTLAVGVSRVYLGVHWPSDVLAGWTVGACWALVCWLALKQLEHRRLWLTEPAPADTPPNAD